MFSETCWNPPSSDPPNPTYIEKVLINFLAKSRPFCRNICSISKILKPNIKGSCHFCQGLQSRGTDIPANNDTSRIQWTNEAVRKIYSGFICKYATGFIIISGIIPRFSFDICHTFNTLSFFREQDKCPPQKASLTFLQLPAVFLAILGLCKAAMQPDNRFESN